MYRLPQIAGRWFDLVRSPRWRRWLRQWYAYLTTRQRKLEYVRLGWRVVKRVRGGAPIAHVANDQKFASTTTGQTTTGAKGGTFTAGNLLIAVVTWSYAGVGASVTINKPSAWTDSGLGTRNNAAPNGGLAVHFLPNNPGGAQTWTWTATMNGGGTADSWSLFIMEFSGVATASPLDLTPTNANGSSNSADPGAQSGTTVSGALLIGAAACHRGTLRTGSQNTTSSVPTTGWTYTAGTASTNGTVNTRGDISYNILSGTQAGPHSVISWSGTTSWEAFALDFEPPQATTAYRDAATRFSLVAEGLRDAATRFYLAVQGYRNAAIRFSLVNQGFRDAALRILVAGYGFRNASIRFVLAANAFRNAAIRILVLSPTWRNASLRFYVAAQGFRDAPLRFYLAIQGYRNAGVRFSLQSAATTAYANAALRFLLAGTEFRNAAIRFVLRVTAYRDAATRILVLEKKFRNAAIRFYLGVQGWRNAAIRFLLALPAYRDGAIRFLLSGPTYRNAALRFALAVQGYRDAAIRFLVVLGNFSDAAIRFLVTGGQAWRDGLVRFFVVAPLRADTFTRANQSGWGTASDGNTWTAETGTGTLSISSNKGTIASSTVSHRLHLGAVIAQADAEGLVKITQGTASGQNSDASGVMIRSTGSGDYYLARFGWNATDAQYQFQLYGHWGGSNHVIAKAAATLAATTSYWIRFRVQGSQLYGKWWQNGSAEPGWTLTATDSNISAAGYVGLYGYGYTTPGIKFDSYTLASLVNPGYRDAAVRFRLAGIAFRNASLRYSLVVAGYRNAAIRFLMSGSTYRDAAVRFRMVGRTYRDVGTRFWLGVTRDAATRFYLTVRAFRDAPTRFSLVAQAWRNAATRFYLVTLGYRQASIRFLTTTAGLAWRDASIRFFVTYRGYRNGLIRVAVAGKSWRDAATRFLVTVRGFRDGALRFLLSGTAWRNAALRFLLTAQVTAWRFAALRFSLTAPITIGFAGVNTTPAVRTWRDTLNGAGGTQSVGPYHPNPDGWYAAGNQWMVDQDIALAKSIGATSMRFDFPWCLMETSNGVWDWTRADYIVNALNAAGITPTPFLAFTPYWINTNATIAPSVQQMYDAAFAVAQHFSGRIKYLEIWNEPDGGHYWNSPWAAFGPVMDAGYRGVKAADPTIQVLFPGLGSGAVTAFWDATLASYPNSFDIMGLHDYTSATGSVVSAARSYLASHGRAGVKCFVGEAGISSLPAKGGSDALQASTMDNLFSSGADVVQWYLLRDDDIWTPDGTAILSTTAGYGLFTRAGDLVTFGTPVYKPSAVHFAQKVGLAGVIGYRNAAIRFLLQLPSVTTGYRNVATRFLLAVAAATAWRDAAIRFELSASAFRSAAIRFYLRITGAGPVLSVLGNKIYDQYGRVVVLRGVNLSGAEYAPVQGKGAFDGNGAQAIGAISRWGANCVRIPLNEAAWLGLVTSSHSPNPSGAAYISVIDAVVQEARAHGLYVILDLHWNAPGTYAAYGQEPMADRDHSLDFWTSVATKYRSDNGIIFDLYNEPYGISWSTWLNGGSITFYDTTQSPYVAFTANAAGMQEMLNAVRATGATNVCIANGIDWANRIASVAGDGGWLGNKPSDQTGNLVCGWHSYQGQWYDNFDHTAGGGPPAGSWSTLIAPIAAQVPIVVGETGDYSEDYAQYAVLATALSAGVSTNAIQIQPLALPNGMASLAANQALELDDGKGNRYTFQATGAVANGATAMNVAAPSDSTGSGGSPQPAFVPNFSYPAGTPIYNAWRSHYVEPLTRFCEANGMSVLGWAFIQSAGQGDQWGTLNCLCTDFVGGTPYSPSNVAGSPPTSANTGYGWFWRNYLLSHRVRQPVAPARISWGVPATASSFQGTLSSTSAWRSNQGTPSVGNPAWLRYDLSGVAAAQRKYLNVYWRQQPPGNNTWDTNELSGAAYNQPRDFLIQLSTDGASWVTAVSVVGNVYQGGAYFVDASAADYKYVRFYVTNVNGSTSNFDASAWLIVHDAKYGDFDAIAFTGDSITANAWQDPTGTNNGALTDPGFTADVNAQRPNFFPDAQGEGVAFQWMQPEIPRISRISLLDATQGGASTRLQDWLNADSSHYVGISFGTNDSNASPPATGPNFYASLKWAVEICLRNGRTPVVPTIPYTPYSSNIQANAPVYNAQIAQLISDYGGVVLTGPDLWTWFLNNPGQIINGDIHPTNAGLSSMRQLWANTMVLAAYPPLAGAFYRDAAIRFLLATALTNLRDSRIRFLMVVQGYRSAAIRFALVTLGYRQAATRFLLAGAAYRNAAIRFRLGLQARRDAAIRFYLALAGYRNAAIRVLIAAPAWRNAALRFVLGQPAWRDGTIRFSLVLLGTAWRNAATRFLLVVSAYRNAATRFNLVVLSYQQVATRFYLTVVAWRNSSIRILISGVAYRDAPLRFLVLVAAYRNAAIRFALAGTTWRNAPIRFLLRVSTFRDASIRVFLRQPVWRDGSIRFVMLPGVPEEIEWSVARVRSSWTSLRVRHPWKVARVRGAWLTAKVRLPKEKSQ